MKINRKNIAPFLGKKVPLFSFKKIIQKNSTPIFLPFYHVVGSPTGLPHIRNLYTTRSKEIFIEDIDFICQYFQAISLEELIQYAKGEKHFKRPVFHLSFDDGLREVYDIILPILEQKGIPCTLFLNTDFIDNKNLFFKYEISLLIEMIKKRKYDFDIQKLLSVQSKNDKFLLTIKKELPFRASNFLLEHQPYMTSSQIEDTLQRGFAIGGHGKSHPYFHKLSLVEQLEEALGSVNHLVEHFGLSYRAFAFPFTDVGVSSSFFDTIFSKNKLDITFGTAGIKHDIPRHFQRVPMEGTSHPVEQIIKGEYLYYKLSSYLGKDVCRRDL